MSGIILKSQLDVEDLTWGATLLGVGGGGTPAEGHKLLSRELAAKGSIECVDPLSLPDDALTVCVTFMGNRAPLTPEQEAQKKTLGLTEWKYENNMVEAVRFFEKVMNRKVDALIIPELGGANTPSPIATASILDIKAVDADYCGRALPEVAQSGSCLMGESMTPIVSVDKWGNKSVIYEIVNEALGERLGKMLAVAAFGNTALALSPVPASVMKKATVHGTVSECVGIGRCAREAKEAGRDVVEAVMAHTGAKKLFQGRLVRAEWSVKDGYLDGYNTFEGEAEFSGHTLRTWFKNENHIAWLDDKPYATSPDMICQIEYNLGRPLLNNECKEGQSFVILGLPARDLHLQGNHLSMLDPRHYGFDIDYLPLKGRL